MATLLQTSVRVARRLVSKPLRETPLRDRLAPTYLRGRGIEIGALFNPQPVPDGVSVRFVDRLPVPALREHYPELADKPLVPVHIVDNGEKLATIDDGTQDFVIANHFLEHCEDPIEAVTNMIRVVRSGGIVFMAIPDKRYTFDRDRPITPLAHLEADHRNGPAATRAAHYEEYVRLVHKPKSEDQAQNQIRDLMQRSYSIHFHVWTQKQILELILSLKDQLHFDIEAAYKNGIEFVVVLRKD